MSLLVMKFGGTSVGNATAIAALAEITREQLVVWDRVVVVVSAMSGVTDLLIQGAQTAASGDAASYKAIASTIAREACRRAGRAGRSHRKMAGDPRGDRAADRRVRAAVPQRACAGRGFAARARRNIGPGRAHERAAGGGGHARARHRSRGGRRRRVRDHHRALRRRRCRSSRRRAIARRRGWPRCWHAASCRWSPASSAPPRTARAPRWAAAAAITAARSSARRWTPMRWRSTPMWTA